MKTIKKVSVSNLMGRAGREVPNQFEITTSDGIYFQSYDSIIAFKSCWKNGKRQIYLDKNYWDH